jgi:hypothetical protein
VKSEQEITVDLIDALQTMRRACVLLYAMDARGGTPKLGVFDANPCIRKCDAALREAGCKP